MPENTKSIEATELKLRMTPTAGLAGEHSPYYRRLLSAGYKGYMQGVIGGAGYYGLLGLAVGAIVAIPAWPFVGAGVLMMIPISAAAGIVKGVNTFGGIGSTAAINAESADLAEQRRYLLDRYYDLPLGAEGDKQAEIIRQELISQNTPAAPRSMFHWKTVAICAGLGAALALSAFFIPGLAAIFGPMGLVAEVLGPVATHLGIAHAAAMVPPVLAGLGTALGAVIGATVGIDRHYVRRWFDLTETLVNDDSHAKAAMLERGHLVERLHEAAAADAQTKLILERRGQLHASGEGLQPTRPMVPVINPTMLVPEPVTMEKPGTKINSPHLENRLADIKQAMQQAPAF